MPDITKLPEISKTLEIEISTLLGEDKSARAITKVIEENPEPLNSEELVDVAPYLSNETLINLTNRLGASNVHDLVPLTPYLPDEALNNIVDKAIEADKISELSDVACFLGCKSLKKIANQLIHSEDSNTLSKFAMYIQGSNLKNTLRIYSHEL